MNQNSNIPGSTPPVNQVLVDVEQEKLEKSLKSGAQWFFWIVGLSLINTIIILVGGDWSFLIGLGVTQLAAVAAYYWDVSFILPIVVFIIVGGIFITLGYFALKRHTWAFVVGMVLYLLDGIIFIYFFEDWLSTAFHVLVLVFLGLGLRANLKYKKYMAQKKMEYYFQPK